MRQILTVSIILGALVIASCSSGSLVTNEPVHELPEKFPNHTAEQIIDSLRASVDEIHSYATDGSIRIESPEFSNSGGLSLRSRIGDSLSAVVRGPLGIVAGRALITRDSLFFADRINGRDYAGSRREPAPIPPPFDALIHANQSSLGLTPLGLPAPIAADTLHPWDASSDSLHYVLARRLPTMAVTYEIDPSIWKIVAYTLESNGNDEAHVEYSLADFDTVDGFVIPRSVTIAYPEDETTLNLEHTRIRVNPDDLRIGDSPVNNRSNHSR